ncbi:MAG: cysteine hydrolase [Synoicihabitans sp.]
MTTPGMIEVPAQPRPFPFQPADCALVIIDMQRDFLEPGGFGASLGNDVSLLQAAVVPTQNLLEAWRASGLPVVHTREGHVSDLSDLPTNKLHRSPAGKRIGDAGPMGRILVRGEPGHGIIEALSPRDGERVIDKPGKGAFYATPLHEELQKLGITQLVIAGVTTEVCVHTTVREANDRGYDCLVLADATASYHPEFHASALAMITAQGVIFGWVGDSPDLFPALATLPSLS